MPRIRRSLDDVRLVFELKGAGLTDRQVSHSTGIPVNTIRAWRNRSVPAYARPSIPSRTRVTAILDWPSLPAETYAYLLGVYLGDGCLTPNGGSWSLRITLDDAYPGIIEECCNAVEAIVGRRPTPNPDRRGARCVVVQLTWSPWIELFPQHGPGRKHHRKIWLAGWKRNVVDRYPGLFLRGLIQTDGWRGVNRVHVKGRDYAYPRYQFSNRSDDIRALFTGACDRLGIKWRQWTRYHISVAQRASVALLDTYVGPKF